MAEQVLAAQSRCPRCMLEVTHGQVFCTGCGLALSAPPQPQAALQVQPAPQSQHSCALCGFEVHPGQAFCTGCGVALRPGPTQAAAATSKLLCPSCDYEIQAGQAFCTGCGVALQTSPPQQTPPAAVKHHCPRCRFEIAAGQVFCTGCGLKLDPASLQAYFATLQYQAGQPAGPQRRSWVLPVFATLVGVFVLMCGTCTWLFTRVDSAVADAGSGGQYAGQPAPSYGAILDQQARLTSAEWEEYIKTLEGRQATNWKGVVWDVQKDFLGDYALMVDLYDGDGYTDGIPEVQIAIPDEDALKYKQNSKVVFSGQIRYTFNILGILTFAFEGATIRQ